MTIFNVGTEDSWLKMSDTVLSFSKQMSNSEIGLQFVSKSSPKRNVIGQVRLGQTERHTDKDIERQKDTDTQTETEKQTDRHTDRQIDTLTDREIEREKGRDTKTLRQRHRETKRQTQTQKDREEEEDILRTELLN